MGLSWRNFSEPVYISGGLRVWGICGLLGAGLALSNHVWAAPDNRLIGSVLALVLVWLSAIDVQRHILPNALTYPLILGGLIFNAMAGRELFALIGALIGFGVLAGMGWVYIRYSGREGLGLGDAKLFAGVGAWIGALALPSAMLVASGLALMSAGIMAIGNRDQDWRRIRIAFGPFIAAGFWWVWLFGPIGRF